jgi:hypothetical protein
VNDMANGTSGGDSGSDTKSLLLKVGAAAGAIVAILSLVFLVFPQIKPIDRHREELAGTIQEVTWQGPSGGYLHYAVTVQIKGYRGEECYVGYSVYTSRGQYVGVGERHSIVYVPDTELDTFGTSISIPYPRTRGSYYVVFYLFAPNDTTLDSQQSPAFYL